MKKYLLIIILVLTLALASNGSADSISGPSSGGELYATYQWDSSNTTFSWSVTQPGPSKWEYDYTFTVPSKGISHLIIQVSESFDPEKNLLDGTTTGWEYRNQNGEGWTVDQGNPGLPGMIFGLKWEAGVLDDLVTSGDDIIGGSIQIVTDREPIDGNFYAKDGGGTGSGADGDMTYSIAAGVAWAGVAVTGTITKNTEKMIQLDTAKVLSATGTIVITLTPVGTDKLVTDHAAYMKFLQLV